MKTRFLPLAVLILMSSLATLRPAEAPAATSVRQLRIETSTAQVIVGRARLSVDPLTHTGSTMSGSYKVEVSPIPVGNEEGKLSVKVTDDDLRKLANGQTVQFTGQAVSTSGNTSEVRGTATPAGGGGGDSGALRIHIASKKGKLVFNTSYHLDR